MKIASLIRRVIPPSLRRLCRNFIERELKIGIPTPLLSNPSARLEISLDMLLCHYRQARKCPVFLQIGANDGVSGDPIYPLIDKHQLRGILVEPQQDVFARLQKNYSAFRQPNFQFLNVAISNSDATRPLFKVRSDVDGPPWLQELASFDKNVILRHSDYVKDLAKNVIVENVECMTFESLLHRTNTDYVDVLQIDVEGYDAELLKLFDVASRKPAIINFEHRHLGEKDYYECLEMLMSTGYKVAVTGDNTLAYLA